MRRKLSVSTSQHLMAMNIYIRLRFYWFQMKISPDVFLYSPSFSPSILRSHPIFLDQQLFSPQTEFANDAASAANIIRSFLEDNQFTAKIEVNRIQREILA